MTDVQAARLVNEIIRQNLAFVQDLAWQCLYEAGEEPGKSIILCVQFCPNLTELIRNLNPNALQELEEMQSQGGNPVTMGVLEAVRFDTLMRRASLKVRLPADLIVIDKVRACVFSRLGFRWLKVDPVANKSRLT